MRSIQAEIVDAFFPQERQTSNTETRTIYGQAVSDSSGGFVTVSYPTRVYGSYASDGDSANIMLPTTVDVSSGDQVVISLFGPTDVKSPVVTGVFQ